MGTQKFSIMVLLWCALTVSSSSEVLAQSMSRNRGFDDVFKSTSKEDAKVAKGDAEVPGVVIAPGTQLYSGIAVLSGLDFNKDQIVSTHQDSVFSSLDLGSAVVSRSGSVTTTALLRGSINYFDIDRRTIRTDIGAIIDTTAKLTDGWTANAGAFFLHDDIDTSQSDRTAAHAGLTYDGDSREGFVRLRSLHREYLNGQLISPNQSTIFDSEKSFSNTRTEAAAGALLMKDQRFALFAQVAVADVNFNRFLLIDPIDRNAQDYWGLAGLRYTLNSQLFVDIGVRLTSRAFAASQLPNFTDASFDGKIVWAPSSSSYFELAYETSFEDPLVVGAYLSRRAGFSLFGEVRPYEKTYVTASANFWTQDQVGTRTSFDEIDADIKVGLGFAPRQEIFVIGAYSHVENNVTRETANSGRIGVGLKYGF